MTVLEIYVYFILPLLVLGIGFGTLWLTRRRFTRLTNAFSKKIENLRAAVALHFAHYNFVRVHSSLRASPAMAAGVSDHLWSLEDLVDQTTA
jgi:small-conductance mechanosensitive channel